MTRLLVLIAIVVWLATRRRPTPPEPETLPQYDPRLWDAMEDAA